MNERSDEGDDGEADTGEIGLYLISVIMAVYMHIMAQQSLNKRRTKME